MTSWCAAGMWGAKLNSGYRELWHKITNDLVEAGTEAGSKGKDQESLAKIVWPLGHREGEFLPFLFYFAEY